MTSNVKDGASETLTIQTAEVEKLGGTDYIFANPGKGNASGSFNHLIGSGIQGYKPKSRLAQSGTRRSEANLLRGKNFETTSQRRLNE